MTELEVLLTKFAEHPDTPVSMRKKAVDIVAHLTKQRLTALRHGTPPKKEGDES